MCISYIISMFHSKSRLATPRERVSLALLQTATFSKAPTPAVRAIANAPQKVTRAAAVITGAPPMRAAREPKSARNNSELPDTAHMSAEVGTNRTIKRGRTAPTEKVTADANAA